MGMDSMVVLTSFVSEMDAQVLVLELQATGIEAMIRKDDCGGMRPMITAERGIEVMVSVGDLEKAQTVLLDIQTQNEGEPKDVLQNKGSKMSGSCFWSGLVLGALASILVVYLVGYLKTDQFVSLGQDYRIDRNGDGKIDMVWHYRADGICIGGKGDENFDRKWDAWWTYKKSINSRTETDTDFNGVPDISYTFRDGVVVSADTRPNEGDVIIRRMFFRDGVLYKEQVDIDEDGSFDVEQYYDPFGRQTGKTSILPSSS